MTKSRDIANSTSTLDVDGGTIKLDGNYPVGTSNVALGDTALDSLGSGNYNTAVGHHALTANTDGGSNTGLGFKALFANTTGVSNTSVGTNSLDANTTGDNNVAMGQSALGTSTTGSYNTAIGSAALVSNTTASNNTAVGYQALYANTTGSENQAFGVQALLNNTTGNDNLALGRLSLRDATTGSGNTSIGEGSGALMTTGSKNTILGRYNGNQGGLDIRTSSNNIVLSDGGGNPRMWINSQGYIHSTPTYNNTTGASANLHIESSGQFVRSTSSLRYKNTVNDATHGLTELKTLRPVTYKGNNDGDTVYGGLIAEEVHDAGLTEFVQYDDDNQPDALAYGNMVSLCIKAIQELSAKNDALEARITALEGA